MAGIITTAPVAVRRPRLPKLRLPRLGLGLGKALCALFGAYGQAAHMAYVEPFGIGRKPSSPRSDDDLDVCDPSW